MHKLGILLVGLALSALLIGCSEEPKEEAATGGDASQASSGAGVDPEPVSPTIPAEAARYDQVGGISFYGDGLQGARTSSGEPYDKAKFTAANKKLVNGSVVRVTNLANEQSILVCINDNGPHVAGRILDISRAAAEKVGLTGVADMRVVEVQKPVAGKICAGRFVTDNGRFAAAE